MPELYLEKFIQWLDRKVKMSSLVSYAMQFNILLYVFLKCDFSCSVLTPYYTEEVLFSLRELESPNEDGVSILFYLQKIFPGFSFAPIICLNE